MLLGGLAVLALVLAAVICVCSGAALWLVPVWFLGLYLALLLLAMGTYRSPAVALMPDVTPSPCVPRATPSST